MNSLLFFHRLYNSPVPESRVLIDSVTSLKESILNSLRVGTNKRRCQSLEFPTHVFRYLFNNKGVIVPSKPGRLYHRCDFPSSHFNDSDFQYFNKEREGCFVVFPIYLYSFVKYMPLRYDDGGTCRPRPFIEKLNFKLVKTREH